MIETKYISPLLDGFTLGNPMSEHDGVRCCPAIKEHSEKKYIVKIIAIPASQVQMDAMIMAGAFKDQEGAMGYYKELSEDVLMEAQFLKELSRLEGFLSYEAWQMEPITKYRLGYEVYLLGAYRHSLEKYVQKNPVTHLQAINLGLDLCSALNVCREAGALYVDLKPSNIFISDNKEYRIGDLGFIKLDALSYTALPSKYRSTYSPPELHDPMASVNLTADTYAVGMILYQLYNEGRLPFPGNCTDEILPSPANADYELAEIIMKAIHPDPDQRWQNPKVMGQALVSYMQRNSVNDTPITPYTPIDTEAQNVRIPQEEAEEENALFIEAIASEEVTVDPDSSVPQTSEQDQISAAPEGDEMPVLLSTEESEAALPEITEESSQDTEPVPDSDTESNPADDTTPDSPADDSDCEMAKLLQKVDELASHEPPATVVIPEIEESEDPFAFATEDSIEYQDLIVPIDPIMDPEEDAPTVKKKKKNRFLSPERKKNAKRFFTSIVLLLILSVIAFAGFLYYQNFYLQTIHDIRIEGERDHLTVFIDTEADLNLITATCADSYGNSESKTFSGDSIAFTNLIPNTLYRIQLDIEGFHKLNGETSAIFTTDASTNILTFTAVTGHVDGSVVLNFTVDGEEPREWRLSYTADGEETMYKTFLDHSVSIDGLTLGKVYTFTLDAGNDLSLSGKTSVDFMASRLILAENLTVTTTNGTDMTIRWDAPGDIIVESWDVRCYNIRGYENQQTVTDTQVYLTGIDPTASYSVEVTAAGMTQPARASITANPINITKLTVDDSHSTDLTVSWEFSGVAPDGWLLTYTVDGSKHLSVIKCASPTAVISPRIPGADYQFSILSAEGTSIFNNIHSYSSPEAENYNDNGLTAEDIQASLLTTPDDPLWTYEKVSQDAFTDTFQAGDSISIVLYAEPNFYLPGSELDILFVIENAYNSVLPEYLSKGHDYWKQFWTGGSTHYGELDLPISPDKPGSYVLKIYFNGKFVAEAPFSITD